MTEFNRRHWLAATAGTLCATAPWSARAEASARHFAPAAGPWREFELTTRVELPQPTGASRVWLPVPCVDSPFQQSLESRWTGNATQARLVSEPHHGARMLMADFSADTANPVLELSSVVRTRSRAVDWSHRIAAHEEADTLHAWLQPTDLMPTDGIVASTAREAIGAARHDVDKVRAIFDWVVSHTYREPKVRGCGVGDIKTMLETGNFGGKCGDINGLFVGLCRAAGVPARDLYGIRIAPSAFGYRELGGNPAKLQGAQHCRSEVFLREHGWVAMDPADVGKVMRLETPEWIKTVDHPLVAPVNHALFGGWEGNWLAFNDAQDLALPGARGGKLGFFMYPQAENANGRTDSLDADNFRYTITAREFTA